MPSNGKIAYPALDATGHQNIFLCNPDGSGQVQLTNGADNALPSWAPNGQALAFTHRDPNSGADFVCLMGADGSGVHMLRDHAFAPCFSPDGSWIAFVAGQLNTAQTEIWVCHPDGSGARQITNDPGHPKTLPSFSPDGAHLVFARYDSAHVALWTVGIDGTAQHAVTVPGSVNLALDGTVINAADDANAPAWGPGNKIAFWSGIENQQGQIWSMSPDGTSRTQLTHNPMPTHNDDPAWSPDGALVLFNTDLDGATNPELWMMTAAGGNQHRVTACHPGPLPGNPAWQPVP